MTSEGEKLTRTYRFALGICKPIVRRWGRLEVVGLEHVPPSGPLIITGNHDSYWDPVVIGIAAIRRRQIRALSKSTLWKVKGLNKVLDGMGQIPVVRGTSDTEALQRAIDELRGGACVGIFPEGTRSLGRTLRARSGVGRLAAAVPETTVICTAITGSTDIPRFPKRPKLHVTFFEPADGQMKPGEDPTDFAVRLLAEMRALAPITQAGRRAPKALEEPPAEDPGPPPAEAKADLMPPAQ